MIQVYGKKTKVGTQKFAIYKEYASLTKSEKK